MRISEHFYSVQGEGVTAGTPAYFIRFGDCNLMCGGPMGSLVKEGKATWWCDSEAIWRKSEEVSFRELVNIFIKTDLIYSILSGRISIVWTGGEPTLARNMRDIIDFHKYLKNDVIGHLIPTVEFRPYMEIETNGTAITREYKDFLYRNISLINCSPKLSNSGVLEKHRVVPESIEVIKNHPRGYFKFVISTEDDIREAENTFIKPFDIRRENVIIMPGVDNRADLPEMTRFLFEMTKKYHYRGVTRQHILAWDKVTGV